VTPDAEAYLRKARESLTSAEADFEAGRFNSAANRAYYAAFQAAVAALLRAGIQPPKDSWEHRFVHSQFSGKLISRSKLFPARYSGVVKALLETRLAADYRPVPIGRRHAQSALRDAKRLLEAIRVQMDGGKE
jgi:uncharacterized protein (UPF0332 family)